jgi:heat shock protein HtpX
MTADLVEDRKELNRQQIVGLARWIAVALVVPPLLLALITVALTRSLLLAPLVLVVAYAALAGFVYTSGRSFPASLLARGDIVPADTRGEARLHNVVEGLCAAHGLTKPDLYLLSSDAHNAFTVAVGERDDKHVALVLTTGLHEALSRIELEGVLSQQLSHVRDGDTALSTFVATVASLPLVGGVVAARAGACLDPDLEQHADIVGTSVTRYPPGLAAALEKVEQHDTAVAGVAPFTAHMWLADPLPVPSRRDGDEPATAEPFIPHPPLADRIAVLREL